MIETLVTLLAVVGACCLAALGLGVAMALRRQQLARRGDAGVISDRTRAQWIRERRY